MADSRQFDLSAAIGEIVKHDINQAINIQQAREKTTDAPKITGKLSIEYITRRTYADDLFIIRSDNPTDPLEKISLIGCDCIKNTEERTVSIEVEARIFDRLFIRPNLEGLKNDLGGQDPLNFIFSQRPNILLRAKQYLDEIRQWEEKHPSAQLARASERGSVSEVAQLLQDPQFSICPLTASDRREKSLAANLVKVMAWAKAMQSTDPDTSELLNRLLAYQLQDEKPVKQGLVETLSDLVEGIKSATRPNQNQRAKEFMIGMIIVLASGYENLLYTQFWYSSVFEEIRKKLVEGIIGLLAMIDKQLLIKISDGSKRSAEGVSLWVIPRVKGPTLFHVLSRLGDLDILDNLLGRVKKLNLDLNQLGPMPNPYVSMFGKGSPIPLVVPMSEQEKIIRRLVYAGVEPPADIMTMVPKKEAEIIMREFLQRYIVFLKIIAQHVQLEPIAGIVLGYLFDDTNVRRARGVRPSETSSLSEATRGLFPAVEVKSDSREEHPLQAIKGLKPRRR